MKEIIPKIETTVMKMIAKYCKGTKSSLSKLFFEEDELLGNFNDTMNSTNKSKNNKKDSFEYKPEIHIYTIYSIEEKVSQFILQKDTTNNVKDYKILYNLLALEAASVDDRTNIPFNHIYRLTKDPKITAIHNLRDEDIEGFVIRDNKNKLMRYLAEKQV